MSAEKPRMGRPPKPQKEKWGKRVTVNFTAAELRTVKAQAGKARLPLSSFVKARLFRRKES